jgi:hypothetical protein
LDRRLNEGNLQGVKMTNSTLLSGKGGTGSLILTHESVPG